MMYQEFVDRTGFEPTYEEFDQIEDDYIAFDGNKDEFCKDFMANGGDKRIYAERAEKIERLCSQMAEMEKEHKATISQRDALIVKLERRLEEEQEWKPYVDEHNVKQSDYEKLAMSAARNTSRYMTDEEALDWVAQETGFARERIQIVHEVPVQEISRHRRIRSTGNMLDRRPIYDATDWHYILFNVKANGTHGWELYNGELTPYWG